MDDRLLKGILSTKLAMSKTPTTTVLPWALTRDYSAQKMIVL